MPLLDLDQEVRPVLPERVDRPLKDRELMPFDIDLEERDPPAEPGGDLVEPEQVYLERPSVALAVVEARIAGHGVAFDDGDAQRSGPRPRRESALDHAHRQLQAAGRGAE